MKWQGHNLKNSEYTVLKTKARKDKRSQCGTVRGPTMPLNGQCLTCPPDQVQLIIQTQGCFWESSTDMHTRPRVTQKLLCRTGSSARSCDDLEGRDAEWGWRAWEEARGGGKCMCTFSWFTLLHSRNHCKAIILHPVIKIFKQKKVCLEKTVNR